MIREPFIKRKGYELFYDPDMRYKKVGLIMDNAFIDYFETKEDAMKYVYKLKRKEKKIKSFDDILNEGTLFDKPTKGMPKYVVHNDYVLERVGKDYEVIEKVYPRDFSGWARKHCEVRPVYSHWLEDDRVKMKAKLAVVEYEKGL